MLLSRHALDDGEVGASDDDCVHEGAREGGDALLRGVSRVEVEVEGLRLLLLKGWKGRARDDARLEETR